MTYKCQKGEPLPSLIQLHDTQPGEAKMMRKRSYPAALRYHKVKQANQPEKYFQAQLMLYSPQTKEVEGDLLSQYEDSYNGIHKVDLVRGQVMEHLETVEEARYYVDEMMKELALEKTSMALDPANDQDNIDCNDEGHEKHPNFSHIDPDQLEILDSIPVSSLYKKIALLPISELQENTRALDDYQRMVVDIGIKYAKDLVKCRKEGNKPPIPPLLVVSGGAGSGKSTVITILAQWIQLILQKEGDNTANPCVIKTSFTGTAASNIDGQTLHTSFSFSFGNQHLSLTDKARDKKRAALEHLKMVIFDEVSMVKSDMIYQLDLRLQEIMQKPDILFGGLSIICFGDLLQLKPIMGKFPFEAPTNKDFFATYQMTPRWKTFESIILEKNHRQGEDKEYAELLNRMRIGKQNSNDIQKLREKVRPEGSKDLEDAFLFIGGKRVPCAKRNKQYLAKLEGQDILIPSINSHDSIKNYQPKLHKDGTIDITGFMKELSLKIGCKVMIIKNIDTSDGLTNGQMGVLEGLIKRVDETVDKLVIKLQNNTLGKKNKGDNPHLSLKYPDCVFIERVCHTYSLINNNKNCGSTATVIQFPVRLAYSVTAHKVQGMSISAPLKVVMDLDSTFTQAQVYVMLSRVQKLEQVFILNKFDESRILVSDAAKKELERLEKESFNRNPSTWYASIPKKIKVASLNCAGLAKHISDIRQDSRLLQADIINLTETSILPSDNTDNFQIPGFVSHFIVIGKGKGIVTYVKEAMAIDVTFEEHTQNDVSLLQMDIKEHNDYLY